MVEVEVQKSIRMAFRNGDSDEVRRLVGDDAERLHLKTSFGTWLHVAASFGNVELVRWLID